MKYRVAINGFGRIGRLFYRAALENKDFQEKFEVVAVNDLTSAEMLAFLLKYDSVHGILNKKISWTSDAILVDDHEIKVFNQRDPEKLPWKERTVLVLKDIEGLSEEEIAKLLKIPKGTVKSRLFRAREKLKEKLRKKGVIE